MQLHFTPEQFAVLKQGFQAGDPSDDHSPEEMPVSIEVLDQVRNLLATSLGTIDLNRAQAFVLEACFQIGTEDNPAYTDVDYDAIISPLRAAQKTIAFELGQQVRLSHPVEYSDGGAAAQVDIRLPQSATGTIIDLGDALNHIVVVRFIEQYACLSEADNCATFDLDSDGDKGIAVAADCLTAV